MWKQSVWTSVIAASLASRYLKNGGVLTLPGAQPALSGTPGKLGWGHGGGWGEVHACMNASVWMPFYTAAFFMHTLCMCSVCVHVCTCMLTHVLGQIKVKQPVKLNEVV